MIPERPKPLKVQFENIPQQLKEKPVWCVWKYDWKDNRWSKVPYRADDSGWGAKSNDSTTWATYDAAHKAYNGGRYDGVGVFIHENLVGVDVDHCISNGEYTPEAWGIIQTLDTYTEMSPSGEGVRCFAYGDVTHTGKKSWKKGDYEMYFKGTHKYLTVTGHTLEAWEPGIQHRTEELQEVYDAYIMREETAPPTQAADRQPLDPGNDFDLVARIRASNQGLKFMALYDRGDTSEYSNDDSRADQALCNILAFWTGKDPAAIDRLFRSSALYREKWERDDYRGWTIGKAITGTPDIETNREPAFQPQQEVEKVMEQFNNNIMPDSINNYLEASFNADAEKMSEFNNKETGFPALDSLSGGLFPGLYIVGGISAVGKTTFVYQLMDQLAERGDHALFFSLEQSRFEMAAKSLSRYTAIDGGDPVQARDIRMNKITDSVLKAKESYMSTAGKRMSVIEGNFNTNVKTIRAYVDAYIQKNGVVPVVAVDYLQIIPGHDVRMSDKQRVDTNVTELKRMSRDYNMILFVISSLNRGNYLAPISFESFKESGGLEYTADVVWGLQVQAIRKAIFENKDKDTIKKRGEIEKALKGIPRSVELVCLKNRGFTTYSIPFVFMPQYDYYKDDIRQIVKDSAKVW